MIKAIKHASFCEFCSNAFCAKCVYKTRAFPKSETKKRGDICLICDRKFYIHEILKEKNKEIESFTNRLLDRGGLNEQLENSKMNL